MATLKEKLVEMLNKALMLEHAARIQYLAHVELIKGLAGEVVIARLKEIASDEEKHEGKFRNLIGGYLGGEPVMELSETHSAKEIKKILEVNLKGEQDAITFYKQIYKTVLDNKDSLPYVFETLEHEIRHVIIDEQEHVVELSLLLGI
ncbi:MAG: ferritin-like domain-containing protein [Candidatus Omnitrophota bacterium]|jgi:bacterioferritin